MIKLFYKTGNLNLLDNNPFPCGGNEEAVPIDKGNTGTESNENTNEEGFNSHSGHEGIHSGSGEFPEDLAGGQSSTIQKMIETIKKTTN
jgi:hypothetical protein